jgi:hypothetical protein
MWKTVLYLIGICALSILSSCEKNPYEESYPALEMDHSIELVNVECGGFGAIRAEALFNIVTDNSITEAGFILKNITTQEEKIQILDLAVIRSKEIVTFTDLSTGNYTVKAYIVYGDPQLTIFSDEKQVNLILNKESDWGTSLICDYVTESGQAVKTCVTGDYILIFIVTLQPLIIDNACLYISGYQLEMKPSRSTSYRSDGYLEYYLEGYIPKDLDPGEYELNVSLNNGAQLFTIEGVILHKLAREWIQVKSLFPGKQNYDEKVAFQNGKDCYVLAGRSHVLHDNLHFWHFDMETMVWDRMPDLAISPSGTIMKSRLFPCSIVSDGKAYVVMLTNTIPTMITIQIWSYTFTSGEWKMEFLTDRDSPLGGYSAAFSFGNKFHIISSSDNQIFVEEDDGITFNYTYDVKEKLWQESTAFLPSGSMHFTSFESPDYFYCIYDDGSIMQYSKKSNEWERLHFDYPDLRPGGIGFCKGHTIYYVGGDDDSITFNTDLDYRGFAYDEMSGKWEQISHFPVTICRGVSFIYEDIAYVGLGLFEGLGLGGIGNYNSSLCLFVLH